MSRKPRKQYEDDDGRTIADMSALQRDNLILPRLRSKKSAQPAGADRPWEQSMSREERRATVFGALGATLLIGLAFLVGLGVLILLLLLVWH